MKTRKSVSILLLVLLVSFSFTPVSNAAPERSATPIDRAERNRVNEVTPSQVTVSNVDEAENIIISDNEERFYMSDRPLRPERGVSEYKNDEILVKLKDSNRPIRVRNTNEVEVMDLVAEYSALDEVEYAEPNYIAYASFVPNDTYYSYQWNFDNADYGGVHAEDAWDTGNGSGVVVAVVDTGVAYETYGSRWNGYTQAPDLAGTNFVQGYDFVNNDTHANDDHGHGTHVAGTVAQATNNNSGTAGLAYGASIMPLKVLDRNGSGNYADIADAIRFAADNGADVITMSLGGSASSASLEDAVNYAYGKGVTLVAASGNDGQNTTSYPAAHDNVISVGATRYDEARAPYSNYGPTLDIVAPGGDTSVDQNGDGYGDGILQQTFGSSRNTFGYYFFQGTSMATPHVAAAAAMVIGEGIATSPDGVRARLQGTADDLGASGRDNQFGHGLLNVAAALEVTISEPPLPPDPEPEPVTDNPPTVLLTNPSDGATVSGTVTLSANSSDDNGIASVDFFIDGVLEGSDSSAPYEASWDTSVIANDSYFISVIAYDSIGQTASATVSVTVENVVEPPPTEIEVFSDSFENGFGQWTQDNQNDWAISTQRSTDGSRSAEVDGRASDATITSIDIDLQDKTNATITFDWYIEHRLDRGEYIAFDVSTNGGTTWTSLDSVTGNEDPENTWHNAEHTLSGISELKLRFRGKMSTRSEDADVDDVVVTAS